MYTLSLRNAETEREQQFGAVTKCLHTCRTYAPPLREPYAQARTYSPECTSISLVACADLCTPPVFPSIRIGLLCSRSCGHLCGSSLRLSRGTEGNTAEAPTVVDVSRVLGMPDGLLIDFLVLSQSFITTSPSRCQRCAAEDLSFGLTPAKKKKKNPPQMSTCYLRFDL